MSGDLEPIATERLRLIPTTADLLEAELEGFSDERQRRLGGKAFGRLADLLGVSLPREWPPLESPHDEDAVEFFLTQLAAMPAPGRWRAHYVCSNDSLVGSAGFFGPPTGGVVEIGYSICAIWRRRGFATEAVGALVERARSPGCSTVVAHTDADNHASIVVLLRNGFAEQLNGRDGRRRFFRSFGENAADGKVDAT